MTKVIYSSQVLQMEGTSVESSFNALFEIDGEIRARWA